MRSCAAIAAHYRVTVVEQGEDGGAYTVTSPTDGNTLLVVASWGGSWDHVSVSHRKRIPNWIEMECVAAIFFADDEYAMQLHVPPGQHVNNHPHCLHWWAPQDRDIPVPPRIFV